MEQKNLRVGLALLTLGVLAVGTLVVSRSEAATHPGITVYKTPT